MNSCIEDTLSQETPSFREIAFAANAHTTQLLVGFVAGLLAFTPVGWVVLGAAILGGVVGGILGANSGRKTGRDLYNN